MARQILDQPQKNLIRLKEEADELDRERDEATVAAYPIGSTVQFKKGNADVEAVIIDHSSWDHIKVRNIRTDREYWISPLWFYYFI